MKKYAVMYNFGSELMGIYDTYAEAKKAVERFEKDDKKKKIYDPGMYNICEREVKK